MSGPSKLALGFLAAIAGAARLLAQDPDPRELIKQSAAAMQRYHSYRLDAVTVIDTKGGAFNNRIEMPTTVAVRRPDRMRVESTSETAEMTIVSDGETTWLYMAPANQYIKRAASSSPDAAVLQSGPLQKLPDINKSIRQEISLLGGRNAIRQNRHAIFRHGRDDSRCGPDPVDR
jgi:outer membrane lipoprotein-sorting protein